MKPRKVRFDARASTFSWQWLATSNCTWLALGGLLSQGASVAAILWGLGNGQTGEQLPPGEQEPERSLSGP